MRKTIAFAIAVLLGISAARAETVVVTADHMVDVLAGRIVDRPQITVTDERISAAPTVNCHDGRSNGAVRMGHTRARYAPRGANRWRAVVPDQCVTEGSSR